MPASKMETGVQVDAAYKRYSANYVLKGLSMNANKGSIYALLGPSGCGKTTLLGCIVGRISLDAGTILTIANKKTDIGYMPQSTALYMQLSIRETFAYYGRVYGLHSTETSIRANRIAELLDLPPDTRIVETLSGGQQRRVSLAVSLIHNPDLLVLDEPTVGLDPVLAESIWKYLLKLSKEERKTIIITTHYIEEAKQADKVGLMRGGVLLCEETPLDLMQKNECDSMENAFLKLSYKQEINKDTNLPEIPKWRPSTPVVKDGKIFKKERFKAELLKNTFFVWRNRPMLLFLFGLPLAVSILFNLAIGRMPQGLKIGILNKEVEHGIVDCDNLHDHGCNLSFPIGCRLVKKLQMSAVIPVEYTNVDKALYDAKTNEIWGVIEVPLNYTAGVLDRLEHNLKTKDPAVESSTINVWLDMSNQMIGNQLKLRIWEAYMSYMENLYEDCGWPVEAFHVPIQMNRPVYGGNVVNLNHYASPAIIILLIFYLPMSYTIGVLVQEKLLGVLERSLVAGVTLIEVFVAHSVIQIILLSIQMSIAMFVLYYIYDSPFIGDPFSTAFLLLLQGISGLAFGFLVSMSFDKMMHATYASLGSVFSYFFLSGMIWPQAGIHFVLLWFKWLVPVAYSVEALRSLTARGWPVTHPVVFKGFVSVSAWIFIFCFLSHVVLRLRKGAAFTAS